jgi:hypothetical protein
MRRIQTFKDYLNEQEKSTEKDILGGINAGEMAKGMMAMALQNLGIKDNYGDIAQTPETINSKPYTACGSTGYVFKPSESTNQDVINLFKDASGIFSKDVKYADLHKLLEDPNNRKIFLVGVRETLETKIKEGDKFVDKILIVDTAAPTEKVASYQITTCPSVIYYGDAKRAISKDGVAIVQPGVTKYAIGTHRKGKPGAHEALVQAGEMSIERYKNGSTSIETYKPGSPDKGSDYGINIHKSSQQRGVCVGPWSAGCQVFADSTDFSNFMAKMKGATSNNNSFLYALIENDVLTAKSAEDAAKAAEKAAKDDEKVDTDRFSEVGGQIRQELGSFYNNSDEPKLIALYNGLCKDQKTASAFGDFYQKVYAVDIIADLDRALDDSELAQLSFKP